MANMTTNISDIYMDMLHSLSDNEKVDLASKLLSSLKAKLKTTKSIDPFSSLSGAWIDEKSAEEVIEDLRKHRTASRNLEIR